MRPKVPPTSNDVLAPQVREAEEYVARSIFVKFLKQLNNAVLEGTRQPLFIWLEKYADNMHATHTRISIHILDILIKASGVPDTGSVYQTNRQLSEGNTQALHFWVQELPACLVPPVSSRLLGFPT
jgi:hypothetical protein